MANRRQKKGRIKFKWTVLKIKMSKSEIWSKPMMCGRGGREGRGGENGGIGASSKFDFRDNIQKSKKKKKSRSGVLFVVFHSIPTFHF